MTKVSTRQMLAVAFASYGGPDVLTLTRVPVPVPAPGEVLIAVGAAGVNQADWRLRAGEFRRFVRLDLPFVPGNDAAGTVTAVGDGVAGVAVGDRVVAVTSTRSGGCYAPYVRVSATQVAVLPDAVDVVDAAALPVAGLTALQMLTERAAVRPGDRVLVHGASGGVGTFAVQIAAALGAQVTAATSAANLDVVRDLGAHRVIDRTADLAAPGTGRRNGYDVVIDAANGLGLPAASRLLRPRGVAVTVNPVAGLAHPDLFAAVRGGRRLRSVRVRPDGSGLSRLVAWVAEGRVRPVVSGVLPLAEAPEAHRRSQTLRTVGKLVLRLDGAPGA